MFSTDALEERLRSVDHSAAAAASAPAPTEFAAAQRADADEMIRRITETHKKAGENPDAVSATVTSSGISYRLEVTMKSATAEALYRRPDGERKQEEAAARAGANIREGTLKAIRRNSSFQASSVFAQPLQLLQAQLGQPGLPAWMQSILNLDEGGQSDAALDALFDQIDMMFRSQDFLKVDQILSAMPVEGPSLTLMMGLLSITRPASERLPSRQRFFNRVYRLCKAMRRDADSLLGGLR